MTTLPYSLRPDPTLLGRIMLASVACAFVLAPAVMFQQWPGAIMFGSLLTLSLLAALYRAWRRILLDEEGIHFSTLGRPGLRVPYGEVEYLDVLIGEKTRYLLVETSMQGSIRLPFEPFGPSEWAKFLQVVANRAPRATMSPLVQAMLGREL